MKLSIELSQGEIAQAVKYWLENKHDYVVDDKGVSVSTEETTVGYGMAESRQHVVTATADVKPAFSLKKVSET